MPKSPLPTQVLLCLLCALLLGRTGAAQPGPNAYPLIPYPASLVPAAGSFPITRATRLAMPGAAKVFAQEAAQLQALLAYGLGQPLKPAAAAGANTIVLVYDATIGAPEGYRLTVTPQRVTLAAKEPAGMFRAVQTVRQLLPPTIERAGAGAPLRLPAVRIEDRPAYAWRGMHLDVARHFFSVNYLKKYLDLLALYKFNKLHLHLTDDQGWRIEIKKYPELTAQGAWRTFNKQDSSCIKKSKDNPDFALDPQHLRQRNGRTEYGGFYTQAQLKDVIAYAAARHIEIIPEVDMPGHMMAALKAYPDLSCTGSATWGKEFSVPLCPCNEGTYTFAENVLSEVAALFPSPYVHIGADEVEKTTWAQAGACTALMQREGIKDVNGLQSYFVRRIERFLQSKGKKMIGWDEVLDGGVDASATVMYWRSWVPDAPARAARNGNQVIMTTNNPLYFDYLPDKNSIAQVYQFKPTPAGLNPQEAKAILGAQANLWTETVPSENRADYMVAPRMTALAEVVWTNRPDYAGYLQRLKAHYARLARMGVHYRVPDLAGFAEESVFTTSTALAVQKPLDNLILRYTTDGSAPTPTSPTLAKPLPISQPVTVKLAAYTPEGLKGDTYTIHYQQQNYAEPVRGKTPAAGLTATYFDGYFPTARMQGAPAKGSAVVTEIAVPKAAEADKFGVQFRGYLDVPATGIYTFYLTCDDGGTLQIADRMVVDNGGLHSAIEKNGQVALAKGLQPLALDFVEGGGGYKLLLQYSLNGSPPQPVPAGWLRH
ncbi:family 20 glycosylhydrolase [Hymenobacter nivis]|uniref:beta-N-acetylhexosaminidase n=1 Tax=Hymenobacter nivis TaxID=1850093 RepID=A0A502HEH4_9BACT|nr:family 20 glycosylhydrolase [Hymenobacter nivis]TPG71873.1 beta-hexosaminidase [Hymenobacter nivis]